VVTPEIVWMAQSGVGKPDTVELLACLMYSIVVPRWDAGQTVMQHLARRHLAEADAHLVATMHQTVLDEDGTAQ
jgi:hypothetical protein